MLKARMRWMVALVAIVASGLASVGAQASEAELVQASPTATAGTGAGAGPTNAVVFDGYDAFYASLGATVFSSSDERQPADQAAAGQPYGDFWRWTSTTGKKHLLQLRGADLLIDGRRLPAAKATRFADVDLAPALGRNATVYANDQHLCVQGVAPSASGTAVRHQRVSLVLDAFGPKARRFELPTLFASCLGVYDAGGGAFRVFSNRYRWAPNTDAPQGVTFEEVSLRAGRFDATGRTLQGTFVEAGNVYRFTSP